MMNLPAITPMPYEWCFDELRNGEVNVPFTPYPTIKFSLTRSEMEDLMAVWENIGKPLLDLMTYGNYYMKMVNYGDYIKEDIDDNTK